MTNLLHRADTDAAAPEMIERHGAFRSPFPCPIADFADRARSLPGEKESERIARLERELEVAEAALGGGIRVAVRPKGGIALRVVADQREGA